MGPGKNCSVLRVRQQVPTATGAGGPRKHGVSQRVRQVAPIISQRATPCRRNVRHRAHRYPVRGAGETRWRSAGRLDGQNVSTVKRSPKWRTFIAQSPSTAFIAEVNRAGPAGSHDEVVDRAHVQSRSLHRGVRQRSGRGGICRRWSGSHDAGAPGQDRVHRPFYRSMSQVPSGRRWSVSPVLLENMGWERSAAGSEKPAAAEVPVLVPAVREHHRAEGRWRPCGCAA